MKKSKYPSVTQPLGRYVDLQHIPPHRLIRATARGTKIHDYIYTDLKELWVPPGLITKEIKGYWKSYQIFKRSMIETTILLEQKLFCSCYGFTGILDWAGILHGETGITVIDWKSPVTEGKTWRAQVAAYWHLAENHMDPPLDRPIRRCGALMLSPTGGVPTFKEYSSFQADAFNDFLSALDAYRRFSN